MKSSQKKFMRQNQTADDDWNDRHRIQNYLRSIGYQTYNNWYIAFNDSGKYMIAKNITKNDLTKYERLRHPDIIIYTGTGYIVIEIDGESHRGGKKDIKRKQDYEDLGIPLIVINKADLKETGESWESYLDRSLKV